MLGPGKMNVIGQEKTGGGCRCARVCVWKACNDQILFGMVEEWIGSQGPQWTAVLGKQKRNHFKFFK